MSKSAFTPMLVLAALAGLAGCGGDPTPAATDAGITVDLGADVDAGGALSCTTGATVPTTGFGTREGAKFKPLTLNTCGGDPYAFYNADYCAAKFTILSIAAGWCNPCRYETSQLPALQAEYEPRGVRLLQVMFQDESYRAASGAYCQAWVDEFGLTNVELNDPAQATQIYFPAGSLPATVIVDNQGTIVFREYGTTDGLASLRAKLDQLLATP